MADRAQPLSEGTESGRIGGMGMNHAVHVRPRLHDLGVNKDLGMTLVLTFNFLTGLDIDDDDMLRTDLFEAEAMGLHKDSILARNAHGNMAENIVPMALVGEDVARISEIFF